MSATAVRPVAMVRPPIGTVRCGLLPLRAEPAADSELVDEAQFGETLTLLGERGEWRYVQGTDGYFGWCEAGELTLDTDTRGARIGVPLAVVRAAPRDDAEPIDELPAGVAFDPDERDPPYAAVDGRWVAVADVRPVRQIPRRYPTPADLLATADAFLGTPYLWGGVSARGIDCSGLTQQVYRLNGVALPRDADQQALFGRPVESALPGDLFFFGDAGVTHTAIATGPRTFVHAPQRGGAVEAGALGADRRLRAIRRYLP